jgi:hypothetical protein
MLPTQYSPARQVRDLPLIELWNSSEPKATQPGRERIRSTSPSSPTGE